MERSVPLWLFKLVVLSGAVGSVMLASLVRSAASHPAPDGPLERIAMSVAGMPGLVRQSFKQTAELVSEDERYDMLTVPVEGEFDYSGFEPVPVAEGIGLEGLVMRVDRTAARPGWRMLAGAFEIDGKVQNAALLLSPDFEVVHAWPLKERRTDGKTPQPPYRKFVHGIELLADGSLVYTYDNSVSLQRIDVCARQLWSQGGNFHHAVTLDETGETVWTFGDYDLFKQIDVETGRTLREFTARKIIAANPDIDPFGARMKHEDRPNENPRIDPGEWMDDPFHFNDVDPLPAALAPAFPQFETGDLLVSARTLNMVFVVDPDTLEMKWWRAGETMRQHDPEWMPNGEILIYDNRMGRGRSDLVAIDPRSFAKRIVFNGDENGFYSRIRGKVERLEGDHLLVTSPQQGRVFELDAGGRVVAEFFNRKPGSETHHYVVSEMSWTPEANFEWRDNPCAPNS